MVVILKTINHNSGQANEEKLSTGDDIILLEECMHDLVRLGVNL